MTIPLASRACRPVCVCILPFYISVRYRTLVRHHQSPIGEVLRCIGGGAEPLQRPGRADRLRGKKRRVQRGIVVEATFECGYTVVGNRPVCAAVAEPVHTRGREGGRSPSGDIRRRGARGSIGRGGSIRSPTLPRGHAVQASFSAPRDS